jgi:hypothetical protein
MGYPLYGVNLGWFGCCARAVDGRPLRFWLCDVCAIMALFLV